jgi:putative transcriptional regulator
MPKLAPTTFSDWFLFQRRKKGIRQDDLAKAIGVSSQTVSAWQTGRNIPRLNPRQTKILCDELGCTLDELAEAFGTTDSDAPQLEHSAG